MTVTLGTLPTRTYTSPQFSLTLFYGQGARVPGLLCAANTTHSTGITKVSRSCDLLVAGVHFTSILFLPEPAANSNTFAFVYKLHRTRPSSRYGYSGTSEAWYTRSTRNSGIRLRIPDCPLHLAYHFHSAQLELYWRTIHMASLIDLEVQNAKRGIQKRTGKRLHLYMDY
jgi:hypothetical protein